MVQMKTETFVSDGTHLTYLETGSGLPVLFLHPTPLDHFYWLPLIERLAEQFPGLRAVVPDLRAHGASELGTNLPTGDFSRIPDAPALTMAQLASDTLALLDQLALHDAAFVGCSIGGYVLLELWRQIPRRMRGLAFICSKPQPDAEANRIKRAETIAKARAGGREALFDGMAQTSIGATARARRPAIVPELRARMTLTTEALVAVQAGLAVRPDSIPTVSTVTVPVFALAGGEDQAVSPAEMEALRVAPGGCDFHVLPDAGHFAAYEQPEKVAALLAPWLKQLGS
jgi:pimeloyl-ACP methyl ester carboxylesterase